MRCLNKDEEDKEKEELSLPACNARKSSSGLSSFLF